MSSMPECKICGNFVHYGPVICEDCLRRKNAQQFLRTDILHLFLEDERKEFDRLIKCGLPATRETQITARGHIRARWALLAKCEAN